VASDQIAGDGEGECKGGKDFEGGLLTETAQTESGAGIQIARVGDRAIATLFDLIAIFPVFPLISYFVAFRLDAVDNGNFELHGAPALVIICLIGLSWIAYYILGEALFDGTFGKQMMGLRVMSAHKTPATISQIVVRNVLRPIDAIGLYLVGFVVAMMSKNRQRVGDIVGTTIVCECRTRRGIAFLLWIAWLAVIFTCCLLVQHFSVSS
jgi:uncharacterized RDD family membrane protein YckC